MDKDNIQKSGVTFLGLLTIVFITLKLTKFIRWSWILVLAPVWVPYLFKGLLFIYMLKSISKKQQPPLKSKWQQRMDDMHALKEKQNHNK